MTNQAISNLIQDCVDDKITFSELCIAVSKMGLKTTSPYEMVMAAESERISRHDAKI